MRCTQFLSNQGFKRPPNLSRETKFGILCGGAPLAQKPPIWGQIVHCKYLYNQDNFLTYNPQRDTKLVRDSNTSTNQKDNTGAERRAGYRKWETVSFAIWSAVLKCLPNPQSQCGYFAVNRSTAKIKILAILVIFLYNLGFGIYKIA